MVYCSRVKKIWFGGWKLRSCILLKTVFMSSIQFSEQNSDSFPNI